MSENGIDKPFYIDLVTFKCYNKYMKTNKKRSQSYVITKRKTKSE